MTTDDVVDGILFAKLPDGRVLQVCLSIEYAKRVVQYAADISGKLYLLDKENAIEWSRP